MVLAHQFSNRSDREQRQYIMSSIRNAATQNKRSSSALIDVNDSGFWELSEALDGSHERGIPSKSPVNSTASGRLDSRTPRKNHRRMESLTKPIKIPLAMVAFNTAENLLVKALEKSLLKTTVRLTMTNVFSVPVRQRQQIHRLLPKGSHITTSLQCKISR